MMKTCLWIGLLLVTAVAQAAFDTKPFLNRPILPPYMKHAAWDAFFVNLDEADATADRAWREVRSVAEFESRRAQLRARFISQLGGFPLRTPLNAQVTGAIEHDGVRIEKILFESRPGVFVTGLLHLPDSQKFARPWPAALFVCGHADEGKNSPIYRVASLACAKAGVAVFSIDPIGQGERAQTESGDHAVPSHLRLGVNALLMGHEFAAFEIWDMMRALDYLETRPELVKKRGGFGCYGNSGGGTQTVLLSALDDRVSVAAPSCYLSSLREQTHWRLLPDCEQFVFGQLPVGVNQASLVLMGGQPVRLHARRDDLCPYTGTRETFRVIQETGMALGRGVWYDFMDAPGPHGYSSALVSSSVSWLAGWLREGRPVEVDKDALIRQDETIDLKKVDFGPTNLLVTARGKVADCAGFRSLYDELSTELDALKASRKVLSLAERAGLVRKLADIDPTRCGEIREVSRELAPEGVVVVRLSMGVRGGYAIPAVEFVPPEVKGSPILAVGDGRRVEFAADVAEALAVGRPVLVASLVGAGEGGVSKHIYFQKNEDEELAKMLHVMGSSLVGRRAEQMLALAENLFRKYGRAPSVLASGRMAVAAAHARAVEPSRLADIKLIHPPAAWEESLRARSFALYATSVFGALRHYDWVDLLKGE